MKMIKFAIAAFSMMMTAQAAQAITIVPVRVSVPVVRAPISVAKPAPIMVQKAAPVNLTKAAAVPNKTNTTVADDVVVAKTSVVVPHATNIAMASVSATSTNKCADKEKAKKYKECRKSIE